MSRSKGGWSAQSFWASVSDTNGIYFNVDTLIPLGDIKAIRTDSKQAARILLDALR